MRKRDSKKKQVILVRRDTGEKSIVKLSKLDKTLDETLENIQNNLFKRAKKALKDNIHEASNFKDFREIIKRKKGMVLAKWCGKNACEETIKDKTSATTRLLVSSKKRIAGKCVHCGKPAKELVYFAKAY